LPCGDAAHRTATAQGSFGPIFGMATGRGGRQHSRQHSIITTSGRRRCAARILAQDRPVRPSPAAKTLAGQCPVDPSGYQQKIRTRSAGVSERTRRIARSDRGIMIR
ncbi:MAG: hypothetical protein ACPIOQ_30375, partial [Promethearchaeia archaeon]